MASALALAILLFNLRRTNALAAARVFVTERSSSAGKRPRTRLDVSTNDRRSSRSSTAAQWKARVSRLAAAARLLRIAGREAPRPGPSRGPRRLEPPDVGCEALIYGKALAGCARRQARRAVARAAGYAATALDARRLHPSKPQLAPNLASAMTGHLQHISIRRRAEQLDGRERFVGSPNVRRLSRGTPRPFRFAAARSLSDGDRLQARHAPSRSERGAATSKLSATSAQLAPSRRSQSTLRLPPRGVLEAPRAFSGATAAMAQRALFRNASNTGRGLDRHGFAGVPGCSTRGLLDREGPAPRRASRDLPERPELLVGGAR